MRSEIGMPDHANDDSPLALRLPTLVTSPFVFAAPHSGRHYPATFKAASVLCDRQLRLSEDAFVDELFEGVVAEGATQLVATHARAYVDLNRAENELDPSMFLGEIGAYEVELNNRVKAGLGVVPRVIGEGMAIYQGPIPIREAFKRIEAVYRPYHDALSDLLAKRREEFGNAVLIDCHSMPSGPELGRRRQSQPDIVLGDCWGTSCSRELTSLAERLFLAAGFKVRRNIPYAGGFATKNYGVPGRAHHALQIEINRSVYMDEARVEPNSAFSDVQARLREISAALIREFETNPMVFGNKAAE